MPGQFGALPPDYPKAGVDGQLPSFTRERPRPQQARSFHSSQCLFHCLGEIGHRHGLDAEPADTGVARFRLGLALYPGEKDNRDIGAQLEEFLREKQPRDVRQAHIHNNEIESVGVAGKNLKSVRCRSFPFESGVPRFQAQYLLLQISSGRRR